LRFAKPARAWRKASLFGYSVRDDSSACNSKYRDIVRFNGPNKTPERKFIEIKSTGKSERFELKEVRNCSENDPMNEFNR